MQSKTLLKRTLFIVVLTGFTLSPAFLSHLISSISILSGPALIIENVVAFPPQEQARPVRLKIPNINVNASVEYVGLTSEGAMDIPQSRDDVAWFELGPRPGENGSAVMAGHYGRENGKGSVFDDLHKLRKGDKLYIEDDKGVTTSFVVRENRRYDPEADASGVFGSSDGKSHLNLVTCEGAWDEDAQQYPKRLVVFTDKEVE